MLKSRSHWLITINFGKIVNKFPSRLLKIFSFAVGYKKKKEKAQALAIYNMAVHSNLWSNCYIGCCSRYLNYTFVQTLIIKDTWKETTWEENKITKQ